MALTAKGHPSQPIVAKSRLLSIPTELRFQIYQEVFNNLVVQLFHTSSEARPFRSTLLNVCSACHTFLIEARPIFLRTVTVATPADAHFGKKFTRLPRDYCLSIRNFCVVVTKENSDCYSNITVFLPNIERLIVDLTPWCMACRDIERALKSKDRVVITRSDANYDEGRCIGVRELFATFEDWVRYMAIEYALGRSKKNFKLLVRLNIENTPGGDAETTIVKCEIDVLSRVSTIEIPGCQSGVLKLPVLIGRDLHPNALCKAPLGK